MTKRDEEIAVLQKEVLALEFAVAHLLDALKHDIRFGDRDTALAKLGTATRIFSKAFLSVE